MMLLYSSSACNEFVRDLRCAGRQVEHYRGQFQWTGPATRCKSEFDLIKADVLTRVPTETVVLDTHFILRPVEPGRLVPTRLDSILAAVVDELHDHGILRVADVTRTGLLKLQHANGTTLAVDVTESQDIGECLVACGIAYVDQDFITRVGARAGHNYRGPAALAADERLRRLEGGL